MNLTSPAALEHAAFYRFVPLSDLEQTACWLRERVGALLGSILVAPEGINGVVAGSPAALDVFAAALGDDCRFAGIVFRRSACRTPPFARMKVHQRAEIVAVGVPAAVLRPTTVPRPTTAVGPRAWRQLIADPDVVVLDNRNAFEFRLGHFRGAVDPGVDHFRDFPAYVRAHAAEWKAAGQRVAMYCTGGIRCEKTGAWMQDLGLDVHALDGGILNYFGQMPDAAHDWQGECFVFDNRIALDTRLQETSTTAEEVYGTAPEGGWRLQRARRLDAGA